MTPRDDREQLFRQLKVAREDRGLSLSDLIQATGMDRSALSKHESGRRPNPTVETIVRYAAVAPANSAARDDGMSHRDGGDRALGGSQRDHSGEGYNTRAWLGWQIMVGSIQTA